MACSLKQVLAQQEKPFSETKIRYLCFQIFQGLAYMHHKGYFHRDLKPDNLLVNNDVIKIADLGSAREVILCSPVYDYAVDMWAMGGNMAELLTRETLFPGESGAEVVVDTVRLKLMGLSMKVTTDVSKATDIWQFQSYFWLILRYGICVELMVISKVASISDPCISQHSKVTYLVSLENAFEYREKWKAAL
ncbi:Serine/threonine-protein kinase MHK [Artemisia annua]|uniref:Serine/threonine-protein kinase MHK n=1 Tax=Artemisia annua TaxID=35608 RepID=A0A2U1M1H4_ARTAN|nr:Serine/threonine-protein kinase MHK [Artemisia annua]